jgi:hypothetical protein
VTNRALGVHSGKKLFFEGKGPRPYCLVFFLRTKRFAIRLHQHGMITIGGNADVNVNASPPSSIAWSVMFPQIQNPHSVSGLCGILAGVFLWEMFTSVVFGRWTMAAVKLMGVALPMLVVTNAPLTGLGLVCGFCAMACFRLLTSKLPCMR